MIVRKAFQYRLNPTKKQLKLLEMHLHECRWLYNETVVGSQDNAPENSEAIEKNIVLSHEELTKALIDGYYDCKIRGQMKRVQCRDPFLTYAFLMCMKKGL